jgi:hypothetical protein
MAHPTEDPKEASLRQGNPEMHPLADALQITATETCGDLRSQGGSCWLVFRFRSLTNGQLSTKTHREVFRPAQARAGIVPCAVNQLLCQGSPAPTGVNRREPARLLPGDGLVSNHEPSSHE